MIEEIRIKRLGVIQDAVVEPHPGFTVVTGETGAGKTMVLTGLGLLLGGRADAGAVRAGDAKAEVEGRLRVADVHVVERVQDAGGDLDDDSLVIARTVAAEGRSRAFLGGRSVPVTVLAELADQLVAVHGQSDQQRLLAPARQRAALDRYAGAALASSLRDYRAAYDALRAVEGELREVVGHARERAHEADLLRHGLQEIEAVAPQAAEDSALAAEASRLSYAEALRSAAEQAHEALASDTDEADALSLVVAARRTLDAQRQHDNELGQLADRLADVAAQVTDVAADLASYADSVESDPARLEAVEQRRSAVMALLRKYGDSVEEVLAWSETAARRLLDLDDDGRVESLTAQAAALRTTLAELAASISAARVDAGARFAEAVTTELAELAMPHAVVSIDVRHVDAPDGLDVVLDGAPRRVAFGPSGIDEVEILLAPHTGAPARPIAKGASGGELSRVMLAVEVVFAGTDPVPTLVFDEVDAGVGGRAAVEIGRRLSRLARSAQVLVVTHLPQVAAFADRQVVVEKTDDGRVTTSNIRVVAQDERVRELARMLAGLEGSDAAAAHAQELLDLAALDRTVDRSTRRRAGDTAGQHDQDHVTVTSRRRKARP